MTANNPQTTHSHPYIRFMIKLAISSVIITAAIAYFDYGTARNWPHHVPLIGPYMSGIIMGRLWHA